MLFAISSSGCVKAFFRREQIPNRTARLSESDRVADQCDLRFTRGQRQSTECELAADNGRWVGKAVRRQRPVGRTVVIKESAVRNGSATRYGELNTYGPAAGIVAL